MRPALISVRQCDTTRCQYWSVKGTTSSFTPACSHTYMRRLHGCISMEKQVGSQLPGIYFAVNILAWLRSEKTAVHAD